MLSLALMKFMHYSLWLERYRLLIISMVSVLVFVNADAQIRKDSLEQILKTRQTLDTAQVIIHEKLAYHYRYNSPDSSFKHAQRGLSLADSLNFDFGRVYCLNHLGSYYALKGQYNTAVSFYQKAMLIKNKKDDRVSKGVALAINNIGVVYFEKGKYDEASGHFRRALAMDSEMKYEKGIAREKGNLGKVKIELNQLDSGLIYLNQALVLENKINHSLGALETMVDIANIYLKKKDFEKAEQMLTEASTLNKDCHLTAKVWIDHLMGNINFQRGNIDAALKFENKAYANAVLLGNMVLQSEIAADLSNVFKSKEDYYQAYAYLDTFNRLSQQIEEEKHNMHEADLYAAFESEKRQKEIDYLEEARDKMLFYNSRLISMRNGLIISLSFSLVLGTIIYKAYRDKRRVNSELMRKFQEVRQKNEEIKSKSQQIEAINATLLDINGSLNKNEFQLKEAQRIAGLGSWEFSMETKTCAWSDQLGMIFFPHGVNDRHSGIRAFVNRIVVEDRMSVWKELKSVFKEGKEAEVQFRVGLEADDVRFINARAVPMFDSRGKMIMIAGTVFDNTIQKKIELTLMDAKEHAELANQSKSVFLANMSHEIRTPLNGILGFTDVLLKENVTPPQREYLKHIKNSGDTLLVLLNDILDFNKIEHGKLEIEKLNYQFRDMVDLALAPYKLQASEKGINLKITCSPEIPPFILGDPHRTRQLLVNYVSNALKFTKSGTVMVDILVENVSVPDGKDLSIKFVVSDSGIGIPEDKQADIFNAFTQADSSTTRKYGGTGLGLAINKQLSILMGGDTGVVSPGALASSFNPGSDFWFTIRVQRGVYDSVKVAASSIEDDFVFNRRIKILVAEDNHINQILMRKVLENMNCEVTIVENGKQAIDALDMANFDVVLLDIQMPVMDGHQATMLIRQSLYSEVPIIGVSANVFKEDVEKSLSVGMDAHIGKPFTSKDLFRVMKNHLPMEVTTKA
jgi:signal transduction histidine kinase/CheY-like chemotaxis protein/tetratricopeptide (TPR) repeat protein